MPTKTAGIRLTNWLMDQTGKTGKSYHVLPEVMFSVSKKLMLHGEGIFSNRDGSLKAEGAGVYAKYRFYTKDRLYHHFRMAILGRYSTNNSPIHQEEIATNGHNRGYQIGFVGTQLLHKTAISLTSYFEGLTGERRKDADYRYNTPDYAINYALSAGRLMLPRKYRAYSQTNLNLMTEVLGQYQPQNGKVYVDMAPSVQMIFNSQARVDIGYRFQVLGDMQRTSKSGFLFRFDYLLFNILG